MSDTYPRVGSALIVRDEANRILLGKRNKEPQRGNWVLPGGKIRPFEAIAEAAARELREETGLEVAVQCQFRVYEIVNPPNEHRIVIYSVGKAVGGILKASDDISEVKFVSLAELSDLPLTPLVRRVLMDAGYIPSETTAVSRIVTQEELPLLIAGAMVGLTARSGGARRGARRRTRTSLSESLLLFDNNASE